MVERQNWQEWCDELARQASPDRLRALATAGDIGELQRVGERIMAIERQVNRAFHELWPAMSDMEQAQIALTEPTMQEWNRLYFEGYRVCLLKVLPGATEEIDAIVGPKIAHIDALGFDNGRTDVSEMCGRFLQEVNALLSAHDVPIQAFDVMPFVLSYGGQRYLESVFTDPNVAEIAAIRDLRQTQVTVEVEP